MTTYQRTGVVSDAALKAGMHRETAARYLEAQAGPEQLKRPHDWRTRQDPLEALWLQAKPWLEASPELEVKALFEHLLGDDPALAPGHALRTFQGPIAGVMLYLLPAPIKPRSEVNSKA